MCRASFMHYYGISQYQFYTALKFVKQEIEPRLEHGNLERDYLAVKTDQCSAFLQRLCDELAEGLPTGFRLELNQRVCVEKCILLVNNIR